jgi:ParB-like chromosome segregation protein Spo0J
MMLSIWRVVYLTKRLLVEEPMKSPQMSQWSKAQAAPTALRTGNYTAAELKRVRALAEDGLSAARIGRIVSRSRKSICGACRYHKIALHGERGAPITVEQPVSSTERTRRWRVSIAATEDANSREARLRRQREQTKRYRKRLRAGKIHRLKPSGKSPPMTDSASYQPYVCAVLGCLNGGTLYNIAFNVQRVEWRCGEHVPRSIENPVGMHGDDRVATGRTRTGEASR